MKTIFWDFNGTLLDDAHLCHDILCEMLEEVGRNKVTYEQYLDIFTFPVRDYYAKVYDLEAVSFDVLAKRFITRYKPRSLEVPLTAGAIETLTEAKRLGFKNVLLSASEINNLYEQIRHFGIETMFDDVLGTDNIHAKDKTDIALSYVKTHPIDPVNTLMVGDTLHDAKVAQAIGCKIVLYTGGHQSKARLSAYQTIDHIHDVIQILSNKGD
jgi:phosphoglycolate phosphatase